MHKKANIKFIIVAAVVIICQGCAATNVTRLGSTAYDPKPLGCNIEVLTVVPTGKKFEELCLLSARGGQSIFESKSVHGLIPDMKDKACQCGADAIILKDSKEGGYNFAGSADRAQASATAVRYLENK
jgi:hypothetical protein